ncbi:MAG: hypothetical protein RQ743_11950 [Bacteroidales bacterium]|nr:hypothetical protein [Bacteroidales bacterium]
MLKYKWVLSREEAGHIDTNYYFSDSRDHFSYILIKIVGSGGKNKDGFFIFSLSRNKGYVRIKLLDHTNDDDIVGKQIAVLTLRYAQRFLADSIEIPSDIEKYFNLGIFTNKLINNRVGRFLYSMNDISSQTVKSFQKITTRYYDGDIAFV